MVDVPGFIGKHDLRIDGKGRLTIPSRFKSVLKDQYGDDAMQVVVRLTLDFNLSVMPASEFAQVARRYEAYDELDEETRRLQEFITGLATVEKVDGSGRVRLSADLRELAGVDRDVTLVGRTTHFDVWDRAKWEKTQAETLHDLKHLAEQVRSKHRAS